ncbi:MAG: hypothetical protein K8S55_09120, partial [Phycisphaerae bacterium]|nr:hypothetical protein [Phycisphaerae bacterium]
MVLIKGGVEIVYLSFMAIPQKTRANHATRHRGNLHRLQASWLSLRSRHGTQRVMRCLKHCAAAFPGCRVGHVREKHMACKQAMPPWIFSFIRLGETIKKATANIAVVFFVYSVTRWPGKATALDVQKPRGCKHPPYGSRVLRYLFVVLHCCHLLVEVP